MATVKRNVIAGYQNVAAWENYFNSLNCSLITVTRDDLKLTINIANVAEIKFTFRSYGSTEYFVDMAYTVNGSSVTGPGVLAYSTTVTVAYTDKLFYIQVADYSNRRFCFLYENINNEDYIGFRGAAGTDQGYYSINTFSLLNVINNNSYTHGVVLNYSMPLGYIDYLENDVLFLNTTKGETDNNFSTCTTVTQDQVITLQGKNYYSVGPNTLVLMDD